MTRPDFDRAAGRRRRGGFFLLIALTVLPVLAADGNDKEYRSFGKALTNGQYGVTLNYRYENVADDAVEQSGSASTLRTTLYYQSALFHGLALRLDFQDVTNLGLADDHANGGAGDSNNGISPLERPLIPDPPRTEALQVWARYSGLPDTDITVGRQEINRGDQRFVGSVAWRQNHQAFSSVRLDQRSLPRTKLFYAYANQVMTVTGATPDMETHLFDAEVKVLKTAKATPYYYRVNYDGGPLTEFSTQTVGVRWTHTWKPLDKWTFPYHVEFAGQTNVGTNPDEVDAGYGRVIFTAMREWWWVRAGYEVLGGSAEDGRFTTPLATLHKFNGWADKFLVTPGNGLQDLYLAAGGKWEYLKFWLYYHDFNSDSESQHYGSELDAHISYTSPWSQVFAFKFALYSADEWREDTNKFWLWTSYKFGSKKKG
jgi:hypothetical protein